MSVHDKLKEIQKRLKAPKDMKNTFGGYKYRSAESILNAVKPLLYEYNCTLCINDEIEAVLDSAYVKATATLTDCETGESVSANAYAREAMQLKGQSPSQMTGTASSYARKYALNGLLAIDDTKDADALEPPTKQEAPKRRVRRKIAVDETCPF